MEIKSKEIEMVSPNERWKKLPETIYSVSDMGRFRNDKNGYIKKQTPTRDGYLTVNIHGKTYQSHRLVAKVFLDNFSNDLVVNHKDFNRVNNCAKNLNMTTIKGNARYSASRGRYKKYGVDNSNCKYSLEMIMTLKTFLELGKSCAEISRATGVCRRYINGLKLGKRRVNG